jgi:uncharacterized protein YbjT (DUF2867 family)
VEIAAGPGTVVSRLLVLGLSGQVGEALLNRLAQRGQPILALSRIARPDAPGLHWLQGQLPDVEWPHDVSTVLSVGPLDVFADWFAAQAPPGVRAVALGSTSIYSKHDSPDAGERDVARRLLAAEATLFATGGAVTVLRPTLIYGDGRDRSLSPLADFARRRGWMVLPGAGTGLRQPVHADDVAEAVLRCLDRPATAGQGYDLPGGERLTAAAMFERALRRRVPGCRIWRLPGWLFRPAVSLAGGIGALPVSSRGFLARLGRDQVADAGPVQTALGLQLRGFQP